MSNSSSNSFTLEERELLIILAAIQFCNIVDFMVMMPLGPQLMRLFGITPQQFGLLVSSYNLSAGLSGFLASFFVDHFDRKKTLIFFVIGFAVGTLLCALSPRYEMLLFARAATGMFGGVLGSLCFAIVGDGIHPSRRGQGTGTLMASFSLASIIGVPLSLYLANIWNWHAPFIMIGTLGLVIVLFVFKWMRPMTAHLNLVKRINPFDDLKFILSHPPLLVGLLMACFLVLGQFTVIPYLSQSLVANAGLEESQLPLIYLVGGVFTIFTSPAIGKLCDRFGSYKIFYIFLILSLFPMYAVTQLSVTPLFLILMVSTSFFVCTGGRMIPAMTILNSLVPLTKRGSFMSMTSASQQLASAVASYIGGSIVLRGASGHLENYGVVGYLGIVLSLMCLGLALILQLRMRPVSVNEARADQSPSESHVF